MRVAQIAQTARVIVMVAAFAVAISGPHDILLLCILATVFGFADALRLPAVGAILPEILPSDDLAKGQGVVSTISRLATVVAGPVAGFALATAGLTAAAALNTILFILALFSITVLRRTVPGRRATPETHNTGGVIQGLRYVLANQGILGMLLTTTALNLALAGPLNLGLVLRVDAEGWDPIVLGNLLAAFGVSAALGAMSLSLYQPRRHRALAGYLWSAGAGVGLLALGYAPTPLGAGVAVSFAGFALGPAGALLLGTVQSDTAPEMMGRVMSLISFSTFGITPIGLAGFGAMASAFGLEAAFLSATTIVILLALCCAAYGQLYQHSRHAAKG